MRVRIDSSYVHGALSLETVGDAVKPWRIPFPQIRLFPSPGDSMVNTARNAAGVRVRFTTEADRVELLCDSFGGVRSFDLTCGGDLLETVALPADADTVSFTKLTGSAATYEIWLTQVAPVVLRELVVPEGATLAPAPDDRPRWTTYGSSISHCGAAHSPARTWPATAARIANLNLTCLGYGGQCHLDPMIARMIRDVPADIISLKVGINVQGGSSLSPRTFRPAVIGMVQVIRERQPVTPIVIVSPIISPPRETTDNAVGLSLTKMREELQDAVARMKDCGDTNLYYADGLELFGEDCVEPYLPDLLHPNGDGYELLGKRFVEQVLNRVPLKKAQA